MNAVCNEHSTCEWVDEAYSKRLWGQLLRRVDSQPVRARQSLLTVRRCAVQLWHDHAPGKIWLAAILVPAPGRALDLTMVQYSRDGRYMCELVLIRITGHAGERLFERLRTNSDEDLLNTVGRACNVMVRQGLLDAEHECTDIEVHLPHGTLFCVLDAGLWVAKTFIPGAKK